MIISQELPIKLTALINDTTGTLIASHYVNPRTKIAVIFGTGCNAAYMERVGDIEKIKDLGIDDDAEIAINCEWVCTKLSVHVVENSNSGNYHRAHLTRSITNIFRGQSTIKL